MSDPMREHWIGELDRQPPGASVRIAGRVVEVDRQGEALLAVLQDETGRRAVSVDGSTDLCPGDLVTLHCVIAAGSLIEARRVQVLVRPRTVRAEGDGEPSLHPDLRDLMRQRARLNRELRDWFDEQGFLEVETGQLVDEPGQEPTLEPFRCADRFLITSPELRMKRMLAAGYERIFELSHVFRSGPGEHSPLHHPEFSLLEWYRAFADEQALVADLEQLLPRCAERLTGAAKARRAGREIPLSPPFERLTVAEAFRRHAAIDLEPFLDGDPGRFRTCARAAGFAVAEDENENSLFFRILIDRVEPELGQERPTILSGYPATMAALAAIDENDPRLARRFECYVLGVELGNAFFELTDPQEQRARFEAERQQKRELGLDPGPLPEWFLRALEAGMPPAAGIALGVDRLLMLISSIDSVDLLLPFPDPL